MAITLPQRAKDVLDGLNFAHIATLMKDGSPQVSPVWVYRHGDNVMIATGVDRIKTRNVKRDSRVAVSIAPVDAPFPPLLLRGNVAEIITGEAAVDGFVEVSKKYGTAEPKRPPAAERVVYRIEVTHCNVK